VNNPATTVTVPRESVSDDTCLVASLACSDGDKVRRGDLIAELETSKASFEIEAPCDGYLRYATRAGERIRVGASLAVISESRETPPPAPRGEAAGGRLPESGRLSKAAEKMMSEHGVGRESFPGDSLVRAADVEEFLKRRGMGGAGAKSGMLQNLPSVRPNHVIIMGAGGHARVCIEILRRLPAFEIYGAVDESLPLGHSVLGVPVIGRDSCLGELRARGLRLAVLGVASVMDHGSRVQRLERLRREGFELPNIIHPQAAVDASVTMGDANVVFANATLSANVSIGRGCIINSGAVVSHDCRLGDNIHLAPGALLAGGVKVGNDTLVGMGAKVFLGLEIGRGVVLSNGVNIDADVPDGAVVKR